MKSKGNDGSPRPQSATSRKRHGFVEAPLLYRRHGSATEYVVLPAAFDGQFHTWHIFDAFLLN